MRGYRTNQGRQLFVPCLLLHPLPHCSAHPETHLTVQPATLDFALYLIMIERLNLN